MATRQLINIQSFGGVKPDTAGDNKNLSAGLTRNVQNGGDGSQLAARGGSDQTGLPTFAMKHTWDTIVSFTLDEYPGKVFLAQVSGVGKWDGAQWVRDVTGTSRIKSLGYFSPDTIDTTVVNHDSITEHVAGKLLALMKVV